MDTKTLEYFDVNGTIFEPMKLNLHQVMYGTNRPYIGWLDPNINSFDIVPICPDPRLLKGDPIKLTSQHMHVIRALNPDDSEWTQQQKMAWLGSSNGGNDMFMSEDDNGNWRIPSPGVSGGAWVNVLWVDLRGHPEGMAAIECIDVAQPLPPVFPPHLVFNWMTLTGHNARNVKTPVLYRRRYGYIPNAWLL